MTPTDHRDQIVGIRGWRGQCMPKHDFKGYERMILQGR
jgi:hypothetical protein